MIATELMPSLVVGNTEMVCRKLKRGNRFSKPNSEPLAKIVAGLGVEVEGCAGQIINSPLISLRGRRLRL